MAHYKVVGSGVVYGRVAIVPGKEQDARDCAAAIVAMHKNAKNGGKPTMGSNMMLTVELDPRDYPFKSTSNGPT